MPLLQAGLTIRHRIWVTGRLRSEDWKLERLAALQCFPMTVIHERPMSDENKSLAKAFAYQCVRNNTVLEEAHTRGGALFSDAQMRRLMIDIVNCIYTILEIQDANWILAPFAKLPRRPRLRPSIKRLRWHCPKVFTTRIEGPLPASIARAVAVFAVRNTLLSEKHTGPHQAIGESFETLILEVLDNVYAATRHPALLNVFYLNATARWAEPELDCELLMTIHAFSPMEDRSGGH